MNIVKKNNFFLIAGAVGPPENYISGKRMQEAADSGIDFIIPLGHPKCKDENIKLLNLAKQAKLKMFISDERCSSAFMDGYSDLDVNEDVIKEIVKDYKDHPALFAYDIMDEPAFKHFDILSRTVELFRKSASNHLTFINLFPGYVFPKTLGTSTFEEYVSDYIRVVKPSVFCYDHYPVRVDWWGDGCFNSFCMDNADSDWYGDIEIVRNETRKAKIPFWMFIQSTAIEKYLRIPTRAEILWQANTALAYGVRGILWFCYWTPDSRTEPYLYAMIDKEGEQTELYNYVKEENNFLKKSGNELINYDNSEIARFKDGEIISGKSVFIRPIGKNNDIIIGTFIKDDKIKIVCVNGDVNKLTKISLKCLKNYNNIEVTNKIDVTINHDFELIIKPGGCILFNLSGEKNENSN